MINMDKIVQLQSNIGLMQNWGNCITIQICVLPTEGSTGSKKITIM